ncbi:hypothetical protein QR680_016645 [Steinernema hermaphroditum]|uniref:Homeobox domain-containing protein n=1 Tax=Steinernema hermaphroditum TaxID=289476 RepID=A0AA39HEA6_9BILA|nr:hypothetical protein QR680_016645 [Steinernema hermaphroditum]
MNMIDPRAFLLNPAIVYDASALALLHQAAANPSPQLAGGGKMLGNNSFRISDILSSSSRSSDAEKADTSGENEGIESGDLRSPSNESSERLRSESPNSTCESGSGSGSKKARKARTIFTDKQLQELENTFEKQKYLSVQDRMELAKRLGLSDTQVKTWYQNRRTKWKRQSAVGMEFLNDASNVSAVQNLLRTPYWSNYFQAHPQLFGQQRLCAPPATFGMPAGAPLIPGLSLDPSAQIPMLFPAGLASLAPGLSAASPLASTAPSKVSPGLEAFQLPSKETSTPSPPPPPISSRSE